MNSLLKKIILRLFRVINTRNLVFFIKKKLARKGLLKRTVAGPLRELAENGAINYKGVVDSDMLDRWISEYGLDVSNITPSEGNLAIPFFNEDVLSLLTDSKFAVLLDDYFMNMYGCHPVLQCIPYLVITYPNIAHENFDSKTNNFPANWHTDYESEFTVHLPLISINPSNTHTMYAVNTHTSLSGPPRNEHAIRNIFRSFGEKTDALMLDVDGWHQGRLEGSSPRIMVQFKYTRGNDLLLHPTEGLSDKGRAQIKRTKKHLSNYGVIKQRLKKDFLFAKNMHTLDPKLSVIKDNFKNYQEYNS
jgi:hypothetical protein